MPAHASWCKDLLVQGLTEECVCEAKPQRADHTAAFLDDGSRVCLLQRCDDILLAHVRDMLQHVQSELAADNGCNGQDLVRAWAEPAQPLAHHVAQSFGHLGLDRGGVRWNVATTVTHDQPGFDQIAQHFLDEQRIAFGLPVHGVGPTPGYVLTPHLAVHLVHFSHAEAAQR
jgi:hypothetical protein